MTQLYAAYRAINCVNLNWEKSVASREAVRLLHALLELGDQFTAYTSRSTYMANGGQVD